MKTVYVSRAERKAQNSKGSLELFCCLSVTLETFEKGGENDMTILTLFKKKRLQATS